VHCGLSVCSEYYETLQCLHDRLLNCPTDQSHLYLIANRIGHLRTFMEQTCSLHRHTPEVTSQRRRDDVTTGHVTSPMSTLEVKLPVSQDASGSDGDDGVDRLKCPRTTPDDAPRSISLHSSGVALSTSTFSSVLFVSAAAVISTVILRPRHCQPRPSL